jgi:hypothetical protein
MKSVQCKSGLRGWRERLRKVYANFEEFCGWDHVYNIAQRLGYKSATTAWRANPMIEGSVNPKDFRKVR